MLRRLVPAALLAITLAGCTSQPTADTGDFSGEEGRVADVIGELSDAATRSEAAKVCNDLMTERLQEAVTEDDSSCVNEVEKAFDDAEIAIVDVVEVTVDGSEATAEVRSEQTPEDVTRTFELVNEDDSWRIDSFG